LVDFPPFPNLKRLYVFSNDAIHNMDNNTMHRFTNLTSLEI
jgi:hypothetical protein